MDTDMANFIGIHMINELIEIQESEDDPILKSSEACEAGFVDPETGAHFEYIYMTKKLGIMKKRRKIIDHSIKE
jgi:hypothetical protein